MEHLNSTLKDKPGSGQNFILDKGISLISDLTNKHSPKQMLNKRQFKIAKIHEFLQESLKLSK